MLLMMLESFEKSKVWTTNGNFSLATDSRDSVNEPLETFRLVLLPMYYSTFFLKLFSGALKKLKTVLIPEFYRLISYLLLKVIPLYLKIL